MAEPQTNDNLILREWLKTRHYGLKNNGPEDTFDECLPLKNLTKEGFEKLQKGEERVWPEGWQALNSCTETDVRRALSHVTYDELRDLIRKADASFRSSQSQKKNGRHSTYKNFFQTGGEMEVPVETLMRLKSLVEDGIEAFPGNMFMQKAKEAVDMIRLEPLTTDAKDAPAVKVNLHLLNTVQVHMSGAKRMLGGNSAVAQAASICDTLTPPKSQRTV